MLQVGTFSPKDIVLTINDYRIEGLADDKFISFEKNSPTFRHVAGIIGKATRVNTRDYSGTITFRVMYTHRDNSVLTKIASEDSFKQTGKLLVQIHDTGSRGTGVQAGNAYLEGVPNFEYSLKSATPNTWKIHYEFLTRHDLTDNSRSLLEF